MKKPLNFFLCQPWPLDLAQEIGKGFIDYARTKKNWECICLENLPPRETLEPWTHVGGIVIAGAPPASHDHPLPFPVLHTAWIPDRPDLLQVDVDPVATGIFAADHLMARGYRRLATVISRVEPPHRMRAEAFANHCRKNDVACDVLISEGASKEDFFGKILDWVRRGDFPAALFCTEDSTAHQLLRLFREEGLHVPDDVAVLGCEDDSKTCEGSFPALSSVHLPYRRVGFEAARMLDAQNTGKPIQNRQIFLPPESVNTRMSTSLFATSDPQLRRAIEFIRQHACEGITVQKAAQHAGLTLDMLQRRFKTEIGHGPNQEIQRVRLTKAKEMLRQTNFSLDEIADATGYQNGHYLSKIFKKKIGQTARKYRNTFYH